MTSDEDDEVDAVMMEWNTRLMMQQLLIEQLYELAFYYMPNGKESFEQFAPLFESAVQEMMIGSPSQGATSDKWTQKQRQISQDMAREFVHNVRTKLNKMT